MELVVDLVAGIVSVSDPDDLGRFSVVAAGRPPDGIEQLHRLGDVLEKTHVGRLAGPDEALVRPDALTFRAAGQVDATWLDRFGAMCEAAATAGWVDQSDGSIRAHIVWSEPEAAGTVAG